MAITLPGDREFFSFPSFRRSARVRCISRWLLLYCSNPSIARGLPSLIVYFFYPLAPIPQDDGPISSRGLLSQFPPSNASKTSSLPGCPTFEDVTVPRRLFRTVWGCFLLFSPSSFLCYDSLPLSRSPVVRTFAPLIQPPPQSTPDISIDVTLSLHATRFFLPKRGTVLPGQLKTSERRHRCSAFCDNLACLTLSPIPSFLP